jgi:hypothetical protein
MARASDFRLPRNSRRPSKGEHVIHLHDERGAEPLAKITEAFPHIAERVVQNVPAFRPSAPEPRRASPAQTAGMGTSPIAPTASRNRSDAGALILPGRCVCLDAAGSVSPIRACHAMHLIVLSALRRLGSACRVHESFQECWVLVCGLMCAVIPSTRYPGVGPHPPAVPGRA